jgi:UDPglucose 6-dehydrogenase
MNGKIGIVGQGFVGRSYAKMFEARGYSVIRYSLEDEYRPNRSLIADCQLVLVAVPTPTTQRGFDGSAVCEALKDISLLGGAVALKSTVLPGFTESVQNAFPHLTVLYAPEFLSEATAEADVEDPFCTIIGLPRDTAQHRQAAEDFRSVLPPAGETLICSSLEAELIKYAHNTLAYAKVVMVNLLSELGQKMGADWEPIKKGLSADPMVAPFHLDPVHKNGRGAGGNCLVKDFEAFLRSYEKIVGDHDGIRMLHALRDKNLRLLRSTGKDLDILERVYGSDIDKL